MRNDLTSALKEVIAVSEYTTGEIAKLCGVTVRTVQYYDRQGILVPSRTSEGGRRLYSDDDLQKMKLICYLRQLGFSLKAISSLLKEDNSPKVVSMVLNQQADMLKADIEKNKKQLSQIEALKKSMEKEGSFSVEKIGDMAFAMENRNSMRKVYTRLLMVGIPIDILEIAAIFISIKYRIIWPILVWAVPTIIATKIMIDYYYEKADYVCPECHCRFRPSKREFFFASHTPRTRKLNCPECGRKSYCLEVYRNEEAAVQ